MEKEQKTKRTKKQPRVLTYEERMVAMNNQQLVKLNGMFGILKTLFAEIKESGEQLKCLNSRMQLLEDRMVNICARLDKLSDQTTGLRSDNARIQRSIDVLELGKEKIFFEPTTQDLLGFSPVPPNSDNEGNNSDDNHISDDQIHELHKSLESMMSISEQSTKHK